MTADLGNLAHLRDALAEADRRRQRDRAAIEGLRTQVRDARREAQHQVRNILSVVRSITRRSVAEGETAEDYQARLDGRIEAFTRLQSHILGNPAHGVDLGSLIADELLTFGFGLGAGADVDGVPMCLKPRPAGVLGLAFHELARMAIEGGAGAGPSAPITVRWRLEGGEGELRHLAIDWTETERQSCGTANHDPTFGREVLEHAVVYELSGSVRLDLRKDGLRCCFRLPTDCLVDAGEQ